MKGTCNNLILQYSWIGSTQNHCTGGITTDFTSHEIVCTIYTSSLGYNVPNQHR